MSIRNGLLALLAEGPEYGFALKKQFEDRTAELWPLNIGQVYTTLGRLVRDGMVEEVAAVPDGDAAQREYRITEAGITELSSWIYEPRPREVPERDELVIKVSLAERLGDVDLLRVVDAQRSVSLQALQRLTRAKAAVDPAELGKVLALDAVALHIEAELRWLDLVEARFLASAPRQITDNHATATRRSSTGEA